MADLSKIMLLNGDSYNFKDAQARADLQAKQNLLNSYSVTLNSSSWTNNTQTVNITGLSASDSVVVSPAPTSMESYVSARVYCSAQSAGTLTFTCGETPQENLTVYVMLCPSASLGVWNGGEY